MPIVLVESINPAGIIFEVNVLESTISKTSLKSDSVPD